jgi:hypothetical protein
MGKLDDALKFLTKAKSISERLGDQLGCASTLSALGKLHELQGDLAQAKAHYQECLAIRERILEPDDPALALVKDRLASIGQQNR